MPKQQRRTFTTEFKAQINPQGYHIKSDALWAFVIQPFVIRNLRLSLFLSIVLYWQAGF